MNAQKPKKALRGLFTRTEPDIEIITTPLVSHQPKEALHIVVDEPVPAAIEIAATQPEASAVETTHYEMSATETNIEMSRKDSEPMAVSSESSREKEALIKTPEAPVTHNAPGIQTEAATALPADEALTINRPQDQVILATQTSNTPQSNLSPGFELKYHQDLFQSERTQWKEKVYISFIHKIDQAQTDAFFLKGKLVAEIKDKYYLDNKKGWTLFCDETLNMNYTTANQYIRVAQEFDVTSHPRKDFGFEHFKALLPLNKEQRLEILEQTPSHLSVKNLRAIVAQKIQPPSLTGGGENNSMNARQVVDTLQKLKIQLARLKPLLLTQEEKWQLYGAFQNLSEEMNNISQTFIAPSESKADTTIAN